MKHLPLSTNPNNCTHITRTLLKLFGEKKNFSPSLLRNASLLLTDVTNFVLIKIAENYWIEMHSLRARVEFNFIIFSKQKKKIGVYFQADCGARSYAIHDFSILGAPHGCNLILKVSDGNRRKKLDSLWQARRQTQMLQTPSRCGGKPGKSLHYSRKTFTSAPPP